MTHDVGGSHEHFGRIFEDGKPNEKLLAWEQQCHALLAVLATNGVVSTDELRRGVESLSPSQYRNWSYYERWSAAMASLLIEGGVIRQETLRQALLGSSTDDGDRRSTEPRFFVGQAVRVKPFLSDQAEWRRPHIRTPGYIYGVRGEIERVCGRFGDPSFLAFGMEAPTVQLYRVRFRLRDIWPEQHQPTDSDSGSDHSYGDVVEAEIYEHWLEASDSSVGHDYANVAQLFDHTAGKDCVLEQHHDHGHDHDHGHSHEERTIVEENAIRNEGPPRPGQALHSALMALLVKQHVVSHEEIRLMCERLDTAGKNLLGATLVTRAWTDPAFRDRLLADPASAANELGIATSNANAPTVLTVVPNTPTTHNFVVCTLCSCYPSGLLGIAPAWYKSRAYRSRAVREPRSVLAEFGLHIPSAKKIRVHDSTADHRYLVLPERPDKTEGRTEDELRSIVTRDTMVGVALPSVH